MGRAGGPPQGRSPGPGAHREAGHQCPLQEANKDITPVVLVIRYAGVANVESKGQQEELHCGPQEPRPLPAEPRLHVELGAGGQPSAQEAAGLTPYPGHRWEWRPEHKASGPRASRFYKQTSQLNPSPPSGTPFAEGETEAWSHKLILGSRLTAKNIMQYIPKEECPE